MRSVPILVLLVISSCWSQTTTTGQAETTGHCSPAVTGSKNTFTINCGIGDKQGQEILAVLNKILADGLEPSAVIQKLDEMHAAVKDLRQNPPDPNRGFLVPANDPNPFVDAECEADTPKDAFRLYLGRRYFVSSAGLLASGIMIHGKSVLGFRQRDAGVAVSASVSSPDGKRIVFVRDNYFKLDNYFRRDVPDPSTLNVFDETNEEPVLHVRYLNPKAILVTGAFSEQGLTVVVSDQQAIKTIPDIAAVGGGCGNASTVAFAFY